jgi:hypothetical protein
MNIPLDVAKEAAKDPIIETTPESAPITDWDESMYGSGSANRNQVLSQRPMVQSDYCALPEEADAWDTSKPVTKEYLGDDYEAQNADTCDKGAHGGEGH